MSGCESAAQKTGLFNRLDIHFGEPLLSVLTNTEFATHFAPRRPKTSAKTNAGESSFKRRRTCWR
jgi:hypothetical protein